jgi:class III cytochrome C family protein
MQSVEVCCGPFASGVALFGGIMKVSRLLTLLGFPILLMLSGSALAQTAPASPIVLKGAPMGAVMFDHTPHLKVAGKCEVCHHASKPGKPLKAAQEACIDCHTSPATPPVTTKLQAAFHNSTATAGLCIDCHKRQNNQGRAAPVKCADCHKKANA